MWKMERLQSANQTSCRRPGNVHTGKLRSLREVFRNYTELADLQSSLEFG